MFLILRTFSSSLLRPGVSVGRAHYSSQGIKVSVLGAAGKTGQPLSLMIKQSPWFHEVALYDIMPTKGIAMELNEIDTCCIATGHEGASGLKTCLEGTHIVLMLGSSAEDDFAANGKIVCALSKACARYSPQAFLVVVTSPVNCMLPTACETYKRSNRCVDPCRMFGLTTLDVVRASTFLAEVLQVMPDKTDVPIVGGISQTTTVPLLSHARPCVELTMEETVKITRAVQEAECDVKRSKDHSGCPSLSAAFAITKFTISLAKALCGHPNIVECVYAMSKLIPTVPYLATQVELGPCGIARSLGIPELSDYECCLMETALPYLKKDIEDGEKLAARCPV